MAKRQKLLDRVILVALLACSWTGQAGAAVTFKGLVVEQRERGEPAVGVVISANGANQTISTSSGQFALVFPNGRPGQAVRLVVERPGWLVVNDLILQTRLPDSEDDLLLELIICRITERDECLIDLHRLKVNIFSEQKFLQAQDQLNRRISILSAAIDRLSKEQKSQNIHNGLISNFAGGYGSGGYTGNYWEVEGLRSQQESANIEYKNLVANKNIPIKFMNKLTEKYFSRDAAEPSDVVRAGLVFFQMGKIDRALQYFNDGCLLQSNVVNLQNNDVVQMCMLKAYMLSLGYNFGKAAEVFQTMVALFPDSYDVWSKYVDFHNILGNSYKVDYGYEKMLSLARKINYYSGIAFVLNSQGADFYSRGRFSEARKNFFAALEISKNMTKENSDFYLPYLAVTQNNIGFLNYSEGRIPDSISAFNESLNIYITINKNHQNKYEKDEQRVRDMLIKLHY